MRLLGLAAHAQCWHNARGPQTLQPLDNGCAAAASTKGEGGALASRLSADDDSLAQWLSAVKRLDVCIADLGAACPGDVRLRAPDSMETVLDEGVRAVTGPYRAPEILCGLAEFTYPVDVWSVGCIVAELHEAKQLFDAGDAQGVLHQIFQMLGWPSGGALATLPRYPSGGQFRSPQLPKFPGSAHFVHFLHNCLQVEPTHRMTAQEAAKHPLVQPHFQVVCDRLPAKFGEMTYVEGKLCPRLAAWLKGDPAWSDLIAAFEEGRGCKQCLQGEEAALGLKYEEAGYTRDSPPACVNMASMKVTAPTRATRIKRFVQTFLRLNEAFAFERLSIRPPKGFLEISETLLKGLRKAFAKHLNALLTTLKRLETAFEALLKSLPSEGLETTSKFTSPHIKVMFSKGLPRALKSSKSRLKGLKNPFQRPFKHSQVHNAFYKTSTTCRRFFKNPFATFLASLQTTVPNMCVKAS